MIVVAAVDHLVPSGAPRSAAPVTVASSDPLPLPGERLIFSGSVSPARPAGRVLLQERAGASWATIASGRLGATSSFAIPHTFPVAGVVTVRAALPSAAGRPASHSAPLQLAVSELHKIKHVVVIMQENRSFDQYFGTFPGAVGIPGLAGHQGKVPCLPSRLSGGCVRPFHDRLNSDFGGPHASWNSTADMACSNPSKRTGCRMNGFVVQAETGGTPCRPYHPGCSVCRKFGEASCLNVMAYHDAGEIPNYWKYARDFVLQDHMFESTYSWSLQAHLYMVSEWSALCANAQLPSSCKNALDRVARPEGGAPHYGWTDITYLLHRNHVSWGYYVFKGTEPDCESNAQLTCKAVKQGPTTPGIWNPLPWFTDVGQDRQLRDVQSLTQFFSAAKAGRLPAVSWIDPNGDVSEHPRALVSRGQTYVTGLINAIMQSPDWNSTAIFLAWDDWGGFYDNVVPPSADQNGFGLQGSGAGDQPVCPARLCRPPDAQLRRVQQVHRGRLPRRSAAQSQHRRPPRSSARCARVAAAAR